MNSYLHSLRHLAAVALAIAALMPAMQSCLDDDGDSRTTWQPTAVVTVCPAADKSFTLILDDSTTLVPANMKASPFGDKEVRALATFTFADNDRNHSRSVYVQRLDSIRTKQPVATLGTTDGTTYGDDPIEIVRDWVTVAEDGYLTLRIRTRWGNAGQRHDINLVSGTNPDNPHEFVLRHNAHGDTAGSWGDALVAFDLNSLEAETNLPLRLTLRWQAFDGWKQTTFDLRLRPKTVANG